MPTSFNWKPYVIGLALTLVAVIAVWTLEHAASDPVGQRNDGYATSVSIADAKVAAAQSMMAGGVVYYNGTIHNNGDRTLTGYTVELTFDDIEGHPLEHDRRVLLDSHLRPIPPHSQQAFEIGFDQVPAGWNQAPPQPRAVAVYVR